ncbi:ribosome maturation factor RimM [Kytococcus sp. Marseille-QA3725]
MAQHTNRERGTIPDGMVRLARIGKPHALRGEVTVQLHTDDPESRFAVGERLQTVPAEEGPLTVASRRVHQGVTLLGFEEATDRNAAEALRGVVLVAPEQSDDREDGFYPADLRGLAVVDGAGELLGTVAELHLRPAQDLLEITTTAGHDVLVPFVEELVPEVDLDRGEVTVTAPAGLLEPLD